MASLDQILAVLTGEKRWQGNQWRVFDAGGAEIADAGGVLWRGVHGALLWPQRQAVPGPSNGGTLHHRVYPSPPKIIFPRRRRNQTAQLFIGSR